jgi:predicted CxxxxCH...CXXCH cytochrome family protein
VDGSTCSASYCHGAFPGGVNGGSGAVMSWESPSGAPLGCTGCHHGPHHQGHSGGGECWICHEHVDTSGTGFSDPALHLNRRVDTVNCAIGCHQF